MPSEAKLAKSVIVTRCPESGWTGQSVGDSYYIDVLTAKKAIDMRKKIKKSQYEEDACDIELEDEIKSIPQALQTFAKIQEKFGVTDYDRENLSVDEQTRITDEKFNKAFKTAIMPLLRLVK